MLKSELIRSIALGHKVAGDDASAVVETVLDGIAEALVAGRRVEIRGFGTLSTRIAKARKSRNPKTGEVVEVPAKRVIRFRASEALIRRPNVA